MQKQEAPVKLPSGPLIHYLIFCSALADAIISQEKDFSGVQCVYGKSYPATEAHPYLDKVPYGLTDDDKKNLFEALGKLPPLKFGMSTEELAEFFDAWQSMCPALDWKPLIWTKEDSIERRYKHKKLEAEFLRALRAEFHAGRLAAVGLNHLPATALEMAAYIPRQSAIDFLTRYALVYEDELDNAAALALAEELGKKKALDSAEIFERRKRYEAEGLKNPTQILAQEFGCSDSYIRKAIRKERDKRKSSFTGNNA